MLEILQTAAAFSTPLVVLFLGLLISRRLERLKLSLSKEKEWRTKWADIFFARSIEFNNAVEDVVLLLFEIGQISQRETDDATAKTKEKTTNIFIAVERLTRTEWLLKIPLQFSPHHAQAVRTTASSVFGLVQELLKTKVGNLDIIHEALFKFNEAARNAHREMLGA